MQCPKDLQGKMEINKSIMPCGEPETKENRSVPLVEGQSPFADCLGFMIPIENTLANIIHGYLLAARERLRQRVNITLKSCIFHEMSF